MVNICTFIEFFNFHRMSQHAGFDCRSVIFEQTVPLKEVIKGFIIVSNVFMLACLYVKLDHLKTQSNTTLTPVLICSN